MGKKILIGITILLISGLLAGWYFFSREAKYFGTSAFTAVPENAAIIVRIHHPGNYTARSLKNPIWSTYSSAPGVAGLYEKLGFADSLLKQYAEINKTLTDKDLFLIYSKENNHFLNLCLIEISSFAEKRALTSFAEQFFSRKGAAVKKTAAGKADLTCYSWKEGAQIKNYCTTFYHGLLIMGENPRIVAQAVSRITAPLPTGESLFAKANKTATDNIDLNIYLNHQYLPQFAQNLFSGTFLNRLNGSNPLADWSEIDLSQKDDELLFNGFSFTGDSLSHYLGLFVHQQPQSFNLSNIFPAETSFFLSYTIGNSELFFRDYEALLKRKGQLEQYKSSLGDIAIRYGVDLQKVVAENLDGVAAMVFTTPDPVLPDENKYLVIRATSESKLESALAPMTIRVAATKKSKTPVNSILYRIDKETAFNIYQTHVSDFGLRVFGPVFSGVKTNYFTIYENCLIMGVSAESLGRFLKANVLQETMGNNKTYTNFTAGLSANMNLYLWCVPGRSLPFFKEMFSADLYHHLENQLKNFRKIESAGWQIGAESGMIYNMARLKYNPEVRESETSIVWKSHLGSSVIYPPRFMINPNDKLHREIVLQDSAYNFIRVNNEGRVLWKIKLSGPIRSTIFQIDYYKDGQLQYFFSTDQALHLIDHDGNYVEDFPVALRSTATNGVAVVDYDRKKDYRFFIAGKDHKVYLYDKKGKLVTDWVPARTEHDVNQPVQFFRVEKKDFIVFKDATRAYLLDRKGKTRVAIKGNFSYSQNPLTFEPGSGKSLPRLVTTDSKGTIVSIGFDGSVRRLSAGQFSPDHYFVYDNTAPGNRHNYIFLDGNTLSVFDQKANPVFSRKFNHAQNSPPSLFTFPDNSRKIGIADQTENQIYLVNQDGSICENFPVQGNPPFTLGFFGNENSGFSLITGTSEGYLNNYRIK